jgi:hypothetical protein
VRSDLCSRMCIGRGSRLCVVICVQGSGHREGLKVVRSDLCSRMCIGAQGSGDIVLKEVVIGDSRLCVVICVQGSYRLKCTSG